MCVGIETRVWAVIKMWEQMFVRACVRVCVRACVRACVFRLRSSIGESRMQLAAESADFYHQNYSVQDEAKYNQIKIKYFFALPETIPVHTVHISKLCECAH